jgi:hypothetical protein
MRDGCLKRQLSRRNLDIAVRNLVSGRKSVGLLGLAGREGMGMGGRDGSMLLCGRLRG